LKKEKEIVALEYKFYRWRRYSHCGCQQDVPAAMMI